MRGQVHGFMDACLSVYVVCVLACLGMCVQARECLLAHVAVAVGTTR